MSGLMGQSTGPNYSLLFQIFNLARYAAMVPAGAVRSRWTDMCCRREDVAVELTKAVVQL